jgi:hypothetical protein
LLKTKNETIRVHEEVNKLRAEVEEARKPWFQRLFGS